jgi:hypothetical protein
MKVKTTKTQKASKAEKPRKACKCSYIDSCYLKGGMTQAEILKATLKKFPGNEKSTMGQQPAHP